MEPFPFGKLGMQVCVAQNSVSVAWLVEPGPSTGAEPLLVPVPASGLVLVGGGGGCPVEHGVGVMLARAMSHRLPALLS